MVAMTHNVYAYSGRTDIAHIPEMPLWMGIIRAAQLILAIILVGLTGYASSVLVNNYYGVTYSGFSLCWFTFSWTVIFMLYLGISAFFIPVAYNYWIHIGLESFTTLFWLITFAVLASNASGISALYTDDVLLLFESNVKTAVDCTKAAAGLGALEWLLFVGTLVAFGTFVHHRRIITASVGPAPVAGEHKMQPMGAQQPYQQPYQPQVPVQQQQYPQYQQPPVEQQQQPQYLQYQQPHVDQQQQHYPQQ